jgi:hypothetical protein
MWYANLPTHFKYSRDSFQIHARLDIGPAYVYMHFLYHASFAVLYYSLVVSIASNLQSAGSMSLPLLTASALDHADTLSNMIADLLGPLWDVGRTPPFVSYASYIATSIQLSYVWSPTPQLATSSRRNIANNSRLLNEMGSFWAVAEQLVFFSNAN